jgi:predicted PurR-regulated permease PerM
MDVETANFLLGVAGVIIMILIGIIGSFLKQIKGLIDELNISVIQLKEFAKNQAYINQSIDKIYERINDLERDVAVLKNTNHRINSNG